MQRFKAFTLAEVLITLGIIGVLLLFVLPVLINEYKKNIVAIKLKDTYNILSNALNMAVKDNGDVINWDFTSSAYDTTFINKYIVPYVKSTPCSYRQKESIYTVSGNLGFHLGWMNTGLGPDLDGNMRCLSNGASIAASQNFGRYHKRVIIDINNAEGPNVYGKDIFEAVIVNELYMNDYYFGLTCPRGVSFCNQLDTGSTTPLPSHDELLDACINRGGNSGYNTCAYLIMEAGWKVPKDYPIKL